ncbi:MAG: methionine ABC transporter ATP-binding protein [Peptoniphilaceae bacterium]|nr:methionine ABC transporter ATP-binding protein [Peptoniphilaceae bacterium]
MIKLENISVNFNDKNEENKIRAVKNVNLEIDKSDIFGIVGYSGAGKSTLVRCINLLQKPSSGDVYIGDEKITKYSDKDLRKVRKNIGMIFQHFNLMNQRTIFENVYYPIRKEKINKEEKYKKVRELLKLVGISEKENAYPKELSGGQKQRVAIARALASEPEILLCDEATSALDPKTTISILKLLKELNKKLNLTIVIITHEMAVIKEICNKCALMQDGEIIESGLTLDIFSKPQNEITKDFINSAEHFDDDILRIKNEVGNEFNLIQLKYLGNITKEPLIIDLYAKRKIKSSILFGKIEYIGDEILGFLIISIDKKEDVEIAKEFFIENNIYAEVI